MNPWWLLGGFAIFLIGLTKSGFGSGAGLTIVPMMAIAMAHVPERGPEAALGLLLPLLVAGDLIAVYQYRKRFSLEIVKKLLVGTAFGVVVGGLFLWGFHRYGQLLGGIIRVEIGLESMALVSLHWWRLRHADSTATMREPLRGQLTGAFSAVSSTLAHAAGPIVAMYLLPLGLDRQLFVGTSAIYFLILNAAKMPVYVAAGQFARVSPLFAIQFLPLVIAGALAGVWLNRKLSDQAFSAVVYFVTFALGAYVLVDGAHILLSSWAHR